MTASNSPGPWVAPQTCAVSLSYDGGLPSHLQTVAPCLDALGLCATFFVPVTRVLDAPECWRAFARGRNELAVAALHEAVNDEGFLTRWTPDAVLSDLLSELEFLDQFCQDGPRCFGYPLPNVDIKTGAEARYDAMQQSILIKESVSKVFAWARSATDGINDPKRCDLKHLRTIRALDSTAEELIEMVELARSKRAWAVVAIEGVGSGEPAMDAAEHAKFSLWLAENRNSFLVAPVREIARRVESCRLSHSAVVSIPADGTAKVHRPI